MAGNAELRSLSAKTVSEIGQAQSCNIDVACVTPTAALYNAGEAVAQLLFVNDDGGEYLCTGTLLNTVPTTNTPYLFTAGHCMKSAKAAHTLNTLWFFDAVNCNSNAVPPYVQLTGGAELLGRSQDHDWALVRLNESPPYGVRYAGVECGPGSTYRGHHDAASPAGRPQEVVGRIRGPVRIPFRRGRAR